MTEKIISKIQLYNSVSKSKEVFVPLEKGKVGMYTCGPTVYHYAHIGNLRTFLFEDFLRRMFLFCGYTVEHVMNITDVGHLTDDGDSGEDKMLKGAKREKKTVWEVAEFYTEAFLEDIRSLNILMPDVLCRATEHIKEQIVMIQKLEKNGFTYSAGGNVYFDSSKDPEYGALVGLDVHAKNMRQARVTEDENKKNPHDFVLWFTKSKFDDQAMKWESPWGVGYPGWHIECSAMASKYLGEQFDIHCGGIDLAPVHHINEIAQAQGAYGKEPWVKYWMHGEFLVLGASEKMSKSQGNFLTLSSLVERGFDALDYRYFCMGGHYRKPLTFSFEALEAAQVARRKLQEKVWEISETLGSSDVVSLETLGVQNLSAASRLYYDSFLEFIKDDLTMPRALAVVWELLKDGDVSDNEKYILLMAFDQVLGLQFDQMKPVIEVPEEVMVLARKRQEARAVKKWDESDALREKIVALGYEVADVPDGFELKKKS